MNIDERMKNMLISDKHFDKEDLVRVLKCDIYELLVNYMDILPNDLFLNFKVDDEGIYVLDFEVKTNRLKIFGSKIN